MGAAARRILLDAWRRRGPLSWLLWPASLVYGLLWRLRRALYRTGMRPIHRVDVPVIVVGNIVAGGGGKTPLVIALVQHLQSLGLCPGVVSRGYGRTAHDCRAVQPDSPVGDVGDEPLLIRRRTGAPVCVAPARIDAARALLAHNPEVDLLVCDDGLQHLGLHRDIEIGVFDARGIGNGFLLPAGPLREPWPRALDLAVYAAQPPAGAGLFRARRALADHGRRADGSTVPLASLRHPRPDGAAPLRAVAAIAQPQAFFAMLRERGLRLDAALALPDHAAFDAARWAVPDAELLLCTEKDAVKLWPHRPDALAVPLALQLDDAFWPALEQLLLARGSSRVREKLSSRHGHTPS